jgi:hypothetical protein
MFGYMISLFPGYFGAMILMMITAITVMILGGISKMSSLLLLLMITHLSKRYLTLVV